MNAAAPAPAQHASVAAARLAHARKNNRERMMITPEGIALPLTLASRGTRFSALMLDLFFIVLLIVGTTPGTAFGKTFFQRLGELPGKILRLTSSASFATRAACRRWRIQV